MGNKLVTLAVHTNKKAQILRDVLELEGIEVHIESINGVGISDISPGVRVRIKESDLARALAIVESQQLFSYDNKETYLIDDGNSRILVPVDFSDYSLNACRIAFNIAKEFNSKVKIFNVYYNPYYPTDLPMAEALYRTDEKDKKAMNILDKVRAKMQILCEEIDKKITSGEFPAVNYSYSLREGIAEEEIAEYCKSYKPSLVIMGTKGGDNNESNALGSVTAEIIEMVNVPILAIPKESYLKDIKSVKHVAFCTTFNQRDIVSFDSIAKFIRPRADQIKITLLHFNEINKKAIKLDKDKVEKIYNYLKEHYPDLNIAYELIDSHDMFKSVGDYIEKEKVEIIAVNTRKRNIFVRLFVPSVSRKILALSNATLLVLRGE